MEVIALASCAAALFYYWEWRRTKSDLDALHDAVYRVVHGKATIQLIDNVTISIEDK